MTSGRLNMMMTMGARVRQPNTADPNSTRRILGLSIILAVLMCGHYVALTKRSSSATMTKMTEHQPQEQALVENDNIRDGDGNTRRRKLGSNFNNPNKIPKWDPPRMEYEDAIVMGFDEVDENGEHKQDPLLLKAMQEVGMVAINRVAYYGRTVQEALAYETFHKCAVSAAHASGNSTLFTKELFLDQGRTVRRTIATQDYPTYTFGHTGGMDPLVFTDEAKAACEEFADASEKLRKLMTRVVRSFAVRLGSELEHLGLMPMPMLTTEGNADHIVEVFKGVSEVVMHGHHLEHFHTYQQVPQQTQSSSNSKSAPTIDMHTDQGLFIAFVPGRIVKETKDGSKKSSFTTQMSEGFYIQLPNGTIVEPQFQADDLVIMLGEGVNHVINPLLITSVAVNKTTNEITKRYRSSHQLRPVPHRLDMYRNDNGGSTKKEDASGQNEARVWYGRMVLPPPRAYNKVFDTTYQEIRSQLIAASALTGGGAQDQNKAITNTDDIDNLALQEPYSIGCSSVLSTKPKEHIQRQRQRQLRVTAEADDMCDPEHELFCWHRCMSTVDEEKKCPNKSKGAVCANDKGTIWDGAKHDASYSVHCATTDTTVETK